MLSKTTTICLALMIVPQAREISFKESRDNNVFGVLSRGSMYGTTAEELEAIYGTPVHDLAAGIRVKDGDDPWTEDPDVDPSFIRLGGFHGIDTPKWYGHSSLYALSDEKYEEFYGEADEELAPLNLTISRLAQVIDWDEVWADEDFSFSQTNVYLDDNGNTDHLLDEPQHIIDLNAALAHHGLPSTDELFTLHTYDNNEQLMALAQEFMATAEKNPQVLRSVGFTNAD